MKDKWTKSSIRFMHLKVILHDIVAILSLLSSIIKFKNGIYRADIWSTIGFYFKDNLVC